jgi:hypothetical protein
MWSFQENNNKYDNMLSNIIMLSANYMLCDNKLFDSMTLSADDNML